MEVDWISSCVKEDSEGLQNLAPLGTNLKNLQPNIIDKLRKDLLSKKEKKEKKLQAKKKKEQEAAKREASKSKKNKNQGKDKWAETLSDWQKMDPLE